MTCVPRKRLVPRPRPYGVKKAGVVPAEMLLTEKSCFVYKDKWTKDNFPWEKRLNEEEGPSDSVNETCQGGHCGLVQNVKASRCWTAKEVNPVPFNFESQGEDSISGGGKTDEV